MLEELQARLALDGSKAVRAAWADLDAAFRPFQMTHIAAVSAARKAQSAGHVDSDEAIRHRLALDKIVTDARQHLAALLAAMERDMRRPRR